MTGLLGEDQLGHPEIAVRFGPQIEKRGQGFRAHRHHVEGPPAAQAALAAERTARQQAEARASGAEAMVAHLKLLIAKMTHDRFGQSSERGQRLLDQMELQLEELEASGAEDDATISPADTTSVVSFTRKKPVRAPLPAHLPRERVVI